MFYFEINFTLNMIFIIILLRPLSTPLSSSPPNEQVQQTSVRFWPPGISTENWSGQSYYFYPWLSSVLHVFDRLIQLRQPWQGTPHLYAIPLDKRGPLNHILTGIRLRSN